MRAAFLLLAGLAAPVAARPREVLEIERRSWGCINVDVRTAFRLKRTASGDWRRGKHVVPDALVQELRAALLAPPVPLEDLASAIPVDEEALEAFVPDVEHAFREHLQLDAAEAARLAPAWTRAAAVSQVLVEAYGEGIETPEPCTRRSFMVSTSGGSIAMRWEGDPGLDAAAPANGSMLPWRVKRGDDRQTSWSLRSARAAAALLHAAGIRSAAMPDDLPVVDTLSPSWERSVFDCGKRRAAAGQPGSNSSR